MKQFRIINTLTNTKKISYQYKGLTPTHLHELVISVHRLVTESTNLKKKTIYSCSSYIKNYTFRIITIQTIIAPHYNYKNHYTASIA